MAMESPTWRILSQAPAVTAHVPAARIFKDYAGHTPTVPYITIEEYNAIPESYVAGRPGIDNFQAQVRVVAGGSGEARQIAEAVRDALEVAATCNFMSGPTREDDTDLPMWSHLSDWSHWTSR